MSTKQVRQTLAIQEATADSTTANIMKTGGDELYSEVTKIDRFMNRNAV